MLSLGLLLSVLGQEQPMFFKMFVCVCLWLKFGSIISFFVVFLGDVWRIYVTFLCPYSSLSELLISSCQVFVFSPISHVSLSDHFLCLRIFPFLSTSSSRAPPTHPSFQILLYSQNCYTDEKNSIGMLHKSRKYKYTFLPHWPVWHFPYLAASLSHLITIRPNNNTTEPVKDTDSHTWAHNTIQHWPTALFHWTNT